MKNKWFHVALLGLLCAGMKTVPLYASDEVGNWKKQFALGTLLGGNLFTNASGSQPGFGVVIDFGMNLRSWVEPYVAAVSSFRLDEKSDDSYLLSGWEIGARLAPWDVRCEPYGFAGVGYSWLGVEDAAKTPGGGSGLSVHVGIGGQFHFSQKFSLASEVAMRRLFAGRDGQTITISVGPRFNF
ncbi:MAG: hypothetical protein HYV03_00345 [Deltaproteobacteria bacterium]|nr:hypothetical protein [Deltaproteobacteria bacterium]